MKFFLTSELTASSKTTIFLEINHLNRWCWKLGFMEGSENLLKAIYEDESLEDYQDDDMLDSETLEEGECRIQIGSLQLTETSKSEDGECTGKIGDLGLTEMGTRGDVSVNQPSNSKIRKRQAKKKKNKNKKTGPAPAINNMNKFVIDTCKRLKERKPYLVWNAVGILGVSALGDLVNEVCTQMQGMNGFKHGTSMSVIELKAVKLF